MTRHHDPRTATSGLFRAGAAYFALVFGAGFVLGMVRVPFLVPRLGERWAELVEMPIMAAVIFLAAELALAVVLQDRTLAEYIRSRDPVSGSVYLALLLGFAAMPRLRLSDHDPCASPAP